MKILLCPDKFKGSLSALKVSNSLSQGLLSVRKDLEIEVHPMADGGDGSMEILNTFLHLDSRSLTTIDPLGRKIQAKYYHNKNSAFIELASASGLVLLDKEELNPLETTTKGTGIMIEDAINQGFQKIYLFIGGSATNDAGVGIANALGFDFMDENGESLQPTGGNLNSIRRIQNKSRLDFNDIDIFVLYDVNNPMYGPNGAAQIYSKQKGASEEEVLILDQGLKNFSRILNSQIQVDISKQIGIGAAGAVGASLVGLLGSHMENGFQLLANITKLEEAIRNADLVITGEGKVDETSFQGKVVGNVLSICNKYKVPHVIVGGIVEELQDLGLNFRFSKSIISMAKDINEAMNFPEKFLAVIGRKIAERL